jgi:hypothetical protein
MAEIFHMFIVSNFHMFYTCSSLTILKHVNSILEWPQLVDMSLRYYVTRTPSRSLVFACPQQSI